MCERYVIPDQERVEREFAPAERWWKFTASFNVAAGSYVPVIRKHERETEGVMLRWGLIPAWAKGDAGKADAAHATLRDIEHSAIFGDAWLEGRRCVLPFAGFYVWQLTAARHRQPHFVWLVSRPVFAVAGIWDQSVTEEDDVVQSCALLMVPANDLLASLGGSDARMPAILSRDECEAWLRATPAQAKTLLRPYPGDLLLTHPVSPRINSLRHNDALLMQPL
jgi:putative SOS response-associated peptidase YedK